MVVREHERARLGAYPNPVTDILTLVLSNATTKGAVVLYDATGSVISRSTWPAGTAKLQVDMRNLQSGLYMAEMTTDSERSTVRVVKVQ